MCPQKFLKPVSHEDTTVDSVKISADQFEAILNVQQKILDSIAQDLEETDILNQLCTLCETLLDNAAATIMLLNKETGLLNLFCAPSVPEDSHYRMMGFKPGVGAGSCAAATHFGRPAYVVDTFEDARWEGALALANDFNICSCWSMPVFDRDSKVIGTFALSSFEHRSPTTFHDRLLKMCASAVSILLERKELRKQAMIDKLTKLWNRTKLDEALEDERNLMSDPKHSYTIMLIDVDLFKAVNDTFGHNVGDTVLTELADILLKNVGSAGLVGRWGGEEFMAILDTEHSDDAAEIAENIRLAVQRHTFETVGNITVSVGVCVVSYKTRTLEVIDLADRALYQAKEHGRNQIVVNYKNKPQRFSILDLVEGTAEA